MNAHAGTNAAPSGAIQGRDSTTPGPHASAHDAHSDINDLCAAYMRGPNRDFGPTPYERIYCNLGKLEPLLSAFRSNASLPSSLEDLKGALDGSQKELADLRDGCRWIEGHLKKNEDANAQQLHAIRTLSDAASQLSSIVDGTLAESPQFMGFPRAHAPADVVRRLSQYVRFVCSVLDEVGETSKLVKSSDKAQAGERTPASMVASLLNNGIVSGTYARYLSGDLATLGCDGSSGRFFTKEACVCWHDSSEKAATGEDFAEYIAAREASVGGGQHTPLGVSTERPSEDIDAFPAIVSARELERRLAQSALVVLYLPGECKGWDYQYLQTRDPVMFQGLDSGQVWMSNMIPPEHIHTILVPEERYQEIIQHIPETMRDKVSAVRGTYEMAGEKFDRSQKGETLTIPNFQSALAECVRGIEQQRTHASGPNTDSAPFTIGVHATRLAP